MSKNFLTSKEILYYFILYVNTRIFDFFLILLYNYIIGGEIMDFNLNFELVTSNERRDFINSKDLSKLTPKELELCANYILYG